MTELNRRTSMFGRTPAAHPDLAVDAVSQARLADLKIDHVQPDPGNPRRHFDQGKLEELAQSFKVNGIIQPIVVRPGQGGNHIIIAGERRWRAARIAGHASIKAIIRPALQDETALLFAQIAENQRREDLWTRDLVDAVQRLTGLGVAKKDIAAGLACDPSRVSRLTALGELPPDLQPLLDTMQVDPLYELAQQWKRDQQAVEDLLARDSQPTRAAIRRLGNPEPGLAPDEDRKGRSHGLAPAQVEGPTKATKALAASTTGRHAHQPGRMAVTVRVRHADFGKGRVVQSPAIVPDRLPVLYDGQEAPIQTTLSELTIVAID